MPSPRDVRFYIMIAVLFIASFLSFIFLSKEAEIKNRSFCAQQHGQEIISNGKIIGCIVKAPAVAKYK